MMKNGILTGVVAAVAAIALVGPAAAADGMKPEKVTISVGNPGTP